MHSDATVAKGIIKRRGLNKVRHIETDVLWLQEQEARWTLPLNQSIGTESIADLMTKNSTAGMIQGYLTKTKLRYAEGRSDIAQHLQRFTGFDRCRLSGKGQSEHHEVLGSDCGVSGKGRLEESEVLGL